MAAIKRVHLKQILVAFIVTTFVLAGQTPPRPRFDSFEVATIKPADPLATDGRWIRMRSADRFEAHNHALRTLIAAAYDLSPKAILGGPPWVDSDRWDIAAKTPGNVRPNLGEQMSMLQQLLGERFNVAFHREPRQLSIYTLTVAKGGSKLKASTVSPDATPQGPPPLIFALSPTLARLPARYATLAEFTSALQRSPLDRPVVDRTGLSGRYDFDLEFAPDDRLWGGIMARPEALVIDKVEQPSAN